MAFRVRRRSKIGQENKIHVFKPGLNLQQCRLTFRLAHFRPVSRRHHDGLQLAALTRQQLECNASGGIYDKEKPRR
jgi:hypothetical protein